MSYHFSGRDKVSIPSSRNRPHGQACLELACANTGRVSIPSSRNRPHGQNVDGRIMSASGSLNPLIEESPSRARRQPAGRLSSAVSIPSSRNRPHGRHNPAAHRLETEAVSIPSSRNRPHGRGRHGRRTERSHGGLNPLIEESPSRAVLACINPPFSSAGLNPLIEESPSRAGIDVRPALQAWAQSQSPHRGIALTGGLQICRGGSCSRVSQSPHRGIALTGGHRAQAGPRRRGVVSIPSSRNRPHGRSPCHDRRRRGRVSIPSSRNRPHGLGVEDVRCGGVHAR